MPGPATRRRRQRRLAEARRRSLCSPLLIHAALLGALASGGNDRGECVCLGCVEIDHGSPWCTCCWDDDHEHDIVTLHRPTSWPESTAWVIGWRQARDHEGNPTESDQRT
jgi:hypothetical protein